MYSTYLPVKGYEKRNLSVLFTFFYGEGNFVNNIELDNGG
jgi:hypothetical protein